MPAWCGTPTLSHGCLHWQHTCFEFRSYTNDHHVRARAVQHACYICIYSMKACALLCTPGIGNAHTYIHTDTCNSQSGSSSVRTVCIQCNSRSCSRSIHTSDKDLSLRASYQFYVRATLHSTVLNKL